VRHGEANSPTLRECTVRGASGLALPAHTRWTKSLTGCTEGSHLAVDLVHLTPPKMRIPAGLLHSRAKERGLSF
jgi:hypothetical protein